MKEEKLSLDELIILGEEFHRLNKWRVQDSDKGEEVFVTKKINGVYMTLGAYDIYREYGVGRYSIYLESVGVDNKKRDVVELAEYHVGGYMIRGKDSENFGKLSELHSLIRENAYALSKKEDRKKEQDNLARERAKKERKNQSVETARRLIKK